MFYFPQFFQVALGRTPLQAGSLMIPALVGQVVVNQIAVRVWRM
jgi:hypothetical protein